MSQRNINVPLLLLVLPLIICSKALAAQNINGEKVIVGKESITIINFPDKVLNINFSDDAAYDYYIPKRREERSISIQFNKEKTNAPNTGLLVNEGGRSHMFRVVFDSAYNINDDTRPPLWYDHSNLKELKTFVQKQKDDATKPRDEASEKREADEQRKREADQRKAEFAAAQEKREQDLAEKAKQAEEQRKAADAKQKQEAADIAKAKKDADDKEKQLKLAADKEAQERKIAEAKAQKDAADLAKQKAAEEQKIKDLQVRQAAEAAAKEQKLKELQAKKDADALAKAQKEKELQDKLAADALAKAQKDAEEKKRIQEEKAAKQKALEEETRRKAAEELARKEAEKKAAQERLAKLEEDRKAREAAKAYSEIGIWQRYGKKGINVYDLPPGHMNTVISDFYIARDTLRHYLVSDSVMKADIPDKINIEASAPVNKGIKITLENIVFKEVHSYYKLKIENNSDEDFLMGKTYMYWYDTHEKPVKIIKSSYLTYISAFPFVRPHTTQQVVFVARSPNMIAGESLVLFIDERRKEKGTASIVISSDAYNHELKKVQKEVKETRTTVAPDNSDKGGKKKRRGRSE